MTSTAGADSEWGLLRRADVLIDLRRYDQALKELAPLIAQPDNEAALTRASRCLYAMERYQETVSMAERAIASNPSSEWPHRLRSLSLSKLAHIAKNKEEKKRLAAMAVDAAREAVRCAPEEAFAYVAAAEAELEAGQNDSAERAAQKSIELAPANSSTWVTHSRVALAKGQEAVAEIDARRAIELEPNSYPAWNNLGVALQRSKRWKEAGDAYFEAARLNPVAALPRGNIARLGLIFLRMVLLLLLLPLVIVPGGVAAYMLLLFGAYMLFRAGGPWRSRAERWGIRTAIRLQRLRLNSPLLQTILFQVGYPVVVVIAALGCLVGLTVSPSAVSSPLVILLALRLVLLWSRRSRNKGSQYGNRASLPLGSPRCGTCRQRVRVGLLTCPGCGTNLLW